MRLGRVLAGIGVALGVAVSGVASFPVLAAPTAQAVRVEMLEGPNRFEPASITVPVGTAVTWVDVSGSHTTTSYDGLWDSVDRLPMGQSYSYTFNQPGVYRYYCKPHENSGMVGTVLVTGGPKS